LEVVGGDRRSKEYAVLKEVTFSYPDKQPIVRDFTFTVGPGVRIGITGPNGTGKSTLVKLLVGELSPQKGTIKALHNLKVAYLDQARERVDDSLRLKEILCPEGDSVVVGGRQHHVIAWAKRFLFTPEQLDRPFSFLSGGEKARALLAVLVSQSVDVLVLDEPTNDLDIPTREILEQALVDFAGAVILVSHDRFMLDAVCTHVVGFDGVSTPTVCADYGQWEELRAEMKLSAKDRGETSDKPKKAFNPSASNGESDKKATAVKLTYAERIELSKMEDTILSAEATLEKLQQELSSGSNDPAWFAAHGAKIAEAETAVKRLYDRWEMLEGKRKG
jgi:ATP-binding cassette subfamily F protein uup